MIMRDKSTLLKRLGITFLIALGWLGLLYFAGTSALGVIDAPIGASPNLPAAQGVTTKVIRIDIPISWQVTRTNFLERGVAARTESFRETWTLEIRPQGETYLASSRAKAPVYGIGKVVAEGTPNAIVLTEGDFARLIGIVPVNWVDDPEHYGDSRTKLVTLSITAPPRGGMELHLNLSEEEHYAIQLDLGSPTVF